MDPSSDFLEGLITHDITTFHFVTVGGHGGGGDGPVHCHTQAASIPTHTS